MVTITTARKALCIFMVLVLFIGCSKDTDLPNDPPEEEEEMPIDDPVDDPEENLEVYSMPFKGSLPFYGSTQQLQNQGDYFLVVSPYDTLSCYTNPYEDYPMCSNDGALILHFDKEGEVIKGIFWESEEPKILISGSEGLYYAGSDANKNNVVRKLNKEGDILWETQIGEAKHDRIYKIQITKDNSIIGVGKTEYSDSYGDLFTFMLNSSGEMLWTSFYEDEHQEIPSDIIATSQNDIIILAQNSHPGGSMGNSMLILKYNDSGNLIWDKDFRFNDWTIGRNILQLNEETLILTGSSYESYTTSNVLIAAIDLSGASLWYKEINDYLHSEYGYLVAKLSEENAVIIGRAIEDATFSITVNSLGNIENTKQLDIPINGRPKQIFQGNDESLLFFEKSRVLTEGRLHDQVDYIKLDL